MIIENEYYIRRIIRWHWRNPFFFPPSLYYAGRKNGDYEVGPFYKKDAKAEIKRWKEQDKKLKPSYKQ